MRDSKSKSVRKIDISVNAREVKDTKDEEPEVMDIEFIKAPGCFKLFYCGKKLFNKLYVMYKCAWMEIANKNYWSEFQHIITNYNDLNETQWFNVNIREAVNQVMLEERVIAEANNVTVGKFMSSRMRNES